MNNYKIITDSTSDLTQEMVDELGVDVIPMDVTIGSFAFKDYPDERDISSHDFYKRIADGEPSEQTRSAQSFLPKHLSHT